MRSEKFSLSRLARRIASLSEEGFFAEFGIGPAAETDWRDRIKEYSDPPLFAPPPPGKTEYRPLITPASARQAQGRGS